MFDTIADMLRGSAPDDLAHALGTDRTQTRRAMEIGLPALITGLRDKTLEPGGAQSLATLLDDGDAALPSDVEAYLTEGDPSRGAAMLDIAFGDRGEPALSALSSASGLSTRLLAQVMSVLAPLATGVLRSSAPSDADGLRSYLAGAVDDLEAKGFGRVVELVSPDLPPEPDLPVAEVIDVQGPAELDVVVDDLDDGTVVQGAFPEPDFSVEVDSGFAADDVTFDTDLPEVPPVVDFGTVEAEIPEVPDFAAEYAADPEPVSIPGVPPVAPAPSAYPSDTIDAGFGDETPIVEPKVDFDDGRGLSAMGWLWWLIGAVLAVLVLLFLIAQCTGDDETADPVDTGAGTGTDAVPVATATPDPAVAQRQAVLDQILTEYPGVSGEVIGDVAVLNGAVADLRTKALLDGAVRDAGLGVQNNVEVNEEAAPAPEGYSLNDLIDAQPELSTLRSLLDQAGLGEALDGNGPFTLFAPTNDAFAAIESELAAVQGDPELLSAYLQYHLLSGEQSGNTIAQVETLQSISGETIDVSVEGGAVRLNEQVPVLVADAGARNGVMHVISGVLIPPSQEPIPEELGEALALNPIVFSAGSTDLSAEAQVELDKVVAFLLETPVDVEVGGHTDADGDEALNQDISQQRAEAVVEYLTGQGVPADSLTAVGYGESQPIAPNDTAENKAQNRRIEFLTG